MSATTTILGKEINALSASYASTAQTLLGSAVSASYATTASYVLNAVSSSFASTASFVRTAQTASYVLNAISSSFAVSASFALAVAGGGGTEIGALIGGGIVVGVFVEGGVNKALVASLTNLSTALPYTIPAFQGTSVPLGAQSFSDGLSNTNAIIAQTGASASTSYAAGIARLCASGSFSDWYLPSNWELNMCYDAAGIVNRILGSTNGFQSTTYQSSTERNPSASWYLDFFAGGRSNQTKSSNGYVRAVRIHTI